ncbi:MAG: hypothetical protein PHQ23_15700, partial [Candidatus Wallbacteria bacterium]|nr:hypothetical protein [Candidatus Wallbacteria bacterium]
CFENLPGSATVLATLNGVPCGFSAVVGKGLLIALGFNLIDKFDYYVPIMEQLMAELGVKKSVTLSGRDLVAVLRANDKQGFLFAGNFHEIDCEDQAELSLGGERLVLDLNLRQRCGVILPLNLELPQSGTLKYATCEVLAVKRKGQKLELDLYAPCVKGFELGFSGLEILKARLSAGKAELRRTDQGWIVAAKIDSGINPEMKLTLQIK